MKYPMILGGDFNILRYSSEKNTKFKGCTQCRELQLCAGSGEGCQWQALNNKYIEVFNLIINSYELREVVMQGGKFTWSNRMNPTLEKLDRVLISKDQEQDFPLCNVKKIPRYKSDHNPLVYGSDLENKQYQEPSALKLLG